MPQKMGKQGVAFLNLQVDKAVCFHTENIAEWLAWDHPFSRYAKFTEKLTFLSALYAHVCVGTRGQELIVFQKNLHANWLADPFEIAFLNFPVHPEIQPVACSQNICIF